MDGITFEKFGSLKNVLCKRSSSNCISLEHWKHLFVNRLVLNDIPRVISAVQLHEISNICL